ncbi:MAG: hypothetical protein Q9M21_07365, partial [Mariprofundaceae bacterium]|nr:hypothetical protein [Mariprofundaceae bacterium]
MDKPIIAKQKSSLSLPRWYYLFFIVVVIVLLIGNILLERVSDKTFVQNAKISNSLDIAAHNIHLYHLWLEEYLTHATDINQQKLSKNIDMTQMALTKLQ